MTKWKINPGQPISKDMRKTWLKTLQIYPFMPREFRQIYVPTGWLPVLHDMAASLADAIAGHPDAENFYIRSLRSLGQESPYVDVSQVDSPSIGGIIRKAQARCRYTCTLCGYTGKFYSLEKLESHLCVHCVAPALLLDALETMDEELALSLGGITIPMSKVPTELRQSLRTWVGIKSDDRKSLQAVEQWDAREWAQGLRGIHRMLKKQQQDREGLWSKAG